MLLWSAGEIRAKYIHTKATNLIRDTKPLHCTRTKNIPGCTRLTSLELGLTCVLRWYVQKWSSILSTTTSQSACVHQEYLGLSWHPCRLDLQHFTSREAQISTWLHKLIRRPCGHAIFTQHRDKTGNKAARISNNERRTRQRHECTA